MKTIQPARDSYPARGDRWKQLLIGAGILVAITTGLVFLALEVALIIVGVLLAAAALFGAYLFLRNKPGR
jgi:drug/metabolite transporter (DMT)-like permease